MLKLRWLLLMMALALGAAQASASPSAQTACGVVPGSADQSMPGACMILWMQGLAVQDVAVVTRTDAYGRDVPLLTGTLVNNGTSAYTDVSLSGLVYDAQNEEIGEGVGYLVNACGAGLLPDFALQPGDSRTFEIPLEMSDPDAEIARSDVTPDATAIDAAAATETPLADGVTQVSDQEVVDVEWIDATSLRFAAGCDRALFTELDWSIYNLGTKAIQPITHPHAEDVTDALRQRLNLTDDAIFAHSMLTFAPQGTRLVYQGDANQFVTAQPDGSFARTIYRDLYNRTLQGIIWLPESRFLAYYFGAYGDPVYYFTADEQSRAISLPPAQGLPSIIVPGASPDGRQAVIAGTFFEKPGYYLKSLTNNNDPQLLFEANPPGNNYPAPVYATDTTPSSRVYIARPVNDQVWLQCYNLTEKQNYGLTSLPIDISSDERAWWWLSPDNRTIALAANGVHGGLWMIALDDLPGCSA